MRRAVVTVIVGGFAFVGIGTGLGLHPGTLGVSLTADYRPAITNAGPDLASSKTGEKTISYGGLEISVPARWPVYWLNMDPNQCVRYDQNAVYVGTPGRSEERR